MCEYRVMDEPAPIPAPPHLHAAEFEKLAREQVADLVPGADLQAMAVVFNLVRLANRIVQDLEVEVHRSAGWSWAGFRVMFTVLVAGELKPREISRLSGVSRASVSSVLNTLERDGFVERVRESTDRRLVTVRLTEMGRRNLLNSYRSHNRRELEWVSELSDKEQVVLIELLRRLLARPGHHDDWTEDVAPEDISTVSSANKN